MSHEHHSEELHYKNYEITKRNRMIAYVLMAVGVISIGYGFAQGDATRSWASLLLGNFYFMGIALAALFFTAVQYVAEVSWSTGIKRVMMAISMHLPFAVIVTILIFLLGGHSIYDWTHHQYYDPASPEYDKILVGKSGYLNTGFFLIRLVAYAVIWAGFAMWLRKQSIKEDIEGGTAIYFKNSKMSAIFLVLFAVTSSTAAWDIIMSIDAHWFSTLFGWYLFAGYFVTGLTVIMLFVLYLQKGGYLPNLNESHIHDIGKFMFAFSIFWCYLYFAQFMLYWYANLPEEVTYYIARQTPMFKPIFTFSYVINFFAPFLVLMSRDAKRNKNFIVVAACFILIGHWLDFFMLIMPGTVGEKSSIGITEVGTTLFFAGVFLYTVHTFLSKAPVVAKNHPMLPESLHHQI